MEIDPLDLVPMPPMADFKIGGHFYLKVGEKDYARCVINEEDLKDPTRAYYLREMTRKYHNEGRLFLNRNSAWYPMEKTYPKSS